MRTNSLPRAKLCSPGKAGSAHTDRKSYTQGAAGDHKHREHPGLRLLAPMSLCSVLFLSHSLILLRAAGVGQELFWTLRKQRWKRYNLDNYGCDPRLQCKMPNPLLQVEKKMFQERREGNKWCVEINDDFRSVKIMKTVPWSQPGRINGNVRNPVFFPV